MKIKAYQIRGKELYKTSEGWKEEEFVKLTFDPKKVETKGVIIGKLEIVPVKAEIQLSDSMLEMETTKLWPYVKRERKNKLAEVATND